MTQIAPAREALLWLQTGASYFAAAGRIGLRVARDLLRTYAPVLRNRNAVAMWLAQGAVAFGLPIAAEHLDVWTTRIILAASIASAILFIGDHQPPAGGAAVGVASLPPPPEPRKPRSFDD